MLYHADRTAHARQHEIDHSYLPERSTVDKQVGIDDLSDVWSGLIDLQVQTHWRNLTSPMPLSTHSFCPVPLFSKVSPKMNSLARLFCRTKKRKRVRALILEVRD